MRTETEIQQEFAKLCAQIGELHYKKSAIENQINYAMTLVVQLEQEARALAAPAPTPATSESAEAPKE